ncbi:MAG: hypothetical protein HC849_01440 [Oscillatoriales cyanobacterium RU_3_3]|nr:hypothetical protein [Microcoleus sp. SU_5_6]NJL66995.1 hypothetical protein [Microcoleus sp. SM1_3_4]NJM59164.1 hypothetical protein [Oscillatoriales cyanobacterium RU_3_3]NJR25192.1 hypothetical protein [Richelia sp. CSU_2_1]
MGASTRMALAGILASLKQSDNCRTNFATAVHPNICKTQRHYLQSNVWREAIAILARKAAAGIVKLN